MSALHRPLSPTGVPAAVYCNERLTKLELLLASLTRVDLTLDELDRFERSIVHAHADNLIRLERLMAELEE